MSYVVGWVRYLSIVKGMLGRDAILCAIGIITSAAAKKIVECRLLMKNPLRGDIIMLIQQ